MRVLGAIGSKFRKTFARPAAGVDVERIALALRSPGIDTRTWLASGTVGVLRGTTFDTTGRDGYFVDALGIRVSVRLEPEDRIVTARVGWMVGRAARFLFPVRPGDEVVVAFPGGDPKSPATCVVGLLSNATAPIPADWNNDRLLIDANVPLEIRAPAVKIDAPALFLNGRKVSPAGEDL